MISRRQFLRRSAAVAAVPYFIPAGVLAADGKPGANDRIGIAGIGIGRQGSGVLANALRQPECRFVAIADVSLPRAKALAEKYQGEPYQNYRKLLERSDVDAIVTATPDHWRALVSIHACQAGKDVYAEKPMSLTVHEGRLMLQAARKYKRVFQVGSQQRSMAVNRASCAYVREGKLGKIQEVIGWNYPSPWLCAFPAQPIPDGLDWDMWCGPAEVVAYNEDLCKPRAKPGWISFQPYSGGEVTGWGAHGLDQIQWALGMDETGPVEIWTDGRKFDPPTYSQPEPRTRGEEICAVPAVSFRYANGVTVTLAKGSQAGGVFVGERGKIEISRGKVTSNPPEIAEEIKRTAGKDENHVLNWIECMKTRARPNADVEIGHRSSTLCHLVNIARWTGRRLRWDPAKEIFPDDPGANQHLDRVRRKPYVLPDKV